MMSDATHHGRPPQLLDYRLVPAVVGAWCTTWLTVTISIRWIHRHGSVHARDLAVIAPAMVVALGSAIAIVTVVAMLRQRHGEPARHSRFPLGSWRAQLILIALTMAVAVFAAGFHITSWQHDPMRRECQRLCRIEVRVERASTALTSPARDETVRSPTRRSRTHHHRESMATSDGDRDRGRRVGEKKHSMWGTSVSVLGRQATIFLITREPIDAVAGEHLRVTGSVSAGSDAPSWGVMRPHTVTIESRSNQRNDANHYRGTGRLQDTIDNVRTRIHRAARAALAGETSDVRGLVLGMSLGDPTSMSASAREAMRRTGTTHLTAISGTHLALIVTTIRALIPGRSRASIVFTLGIISGLVVAVGAQPSIIRAALMLAATSIAELAGREGHSPSALALVVLGCLIINPWLAVSWGFALSVVATLAVMSAARLAHGARAPLGAVAVAISAHFATAPLIWMMTGRFAVYSPVVNIVLAAIVAPMTVVSLATSVTAWICPQVSAMIVPVARVCARIIIDTTGFAAALPGSVVTGWVASIGAWAPVFVGVVWACSRARRQS